MKTKLNLITIFALLTNLCFCQSYNPGISKYVEFLKNQNTTAKDYVLKLFKKYDIVILCERNHSEMTQYDLIYDIVSSDYFQKNVGNIFTEIGSYSNRQNTLNFIKTKFSNDSIRQIKQVEVYRNGYFPFWNNTNFYDFIGRLNLLNTRLSEKKQINLLLSGSLNPSNDERKDLAGMKKYIIENYLKRDSLMASYIITTFDSIKLTSTRKKALVVMNYRHAFSKNLVPNEANVGTFLFEKYPGKVANVYINSLALSNELDERDKDKPKMFQGNVHVPIQGGKWDASFKAANKENVGFDFKNSPFGKDHFDIWTATQNNYNYEDIFTGFVFYLPLEKHILSTGVKNFLQGVDIEKMINEWNLFYKALGKNEEIEYSPEIKDALIEEASTIKAEKYPDLEKYNDIIEYWLKK